MEANYIKDNRNNWPLQLHSYFSNSTKARRHYKKSENGAVFLQSVRKLIH
jgi:hypothetical protein